MNTRTTLTALMALVVLISVGGVASATGPTATETPTNETKNNSSVDVGTKLSSALAMQEQEVKGELAQTEFAMKLKNADSKEERAKIIASKVESLSNSTKDIQEKKKDLKQKYKSGNISKSEYQTKMASLSEQIENSNEMTNKSANATKGIPSDVLKKHGVNASAIQTLKESARNLSGEEVSSIARSIAGNDDGKANRPDDAGKPDDKGKSGDKGKDSGTDKADGKKSGNDRASGTDKADGKKSGNDRASGTDRTETETNTTSTESGTENTTTTETESNPGSDRP